ncbi:Uncharacterised protein [Pseudomonas aeruginosa]|nr:Uncharacterised protein [Pseudomonas aeruginosa]
MLEGQRGGQAEAQVASHRGHRRDQRQRVVHRYLGGLADRRVAIAVEHVVDAQHVGDEQSVETAAFEQPRQVGPVLQVLVLRGAVARMRPEAGRLVADTVHFEGVETDFARHGDSLACLCIRHPVHSPCRAAGPRRARPGWQAPVAGRAQLLGKCWRINTFARPTRAPNPEPRRANSAPALSASAPEPHPADSRERLFALPEHLH